MSSVVYAALYDLDTHVVLLIDLESLLLKAIASIHSSAIERSIDTRRRI